MTGLRPLAVALSMCTLGALAALPVAGQIPDKFENLQVLPKDITKKELVPMMRGFAGALGVRCKNCHVGADNLEGMDFASDEKPEKLAAREMMKMVAKINEDYVGKIKTMRATRVQVECVTCHRGVPVPKRIDDIVADTLASDGAEAAKARYLELKEKYYGRAAYDFGAPPLNRVAEDLARADQLADAIAIAEFNVELNPAEAWSRMMLGGFYVQNGDKEKAIPIFEQLVAEDPENRQAKAMLERLKAPPAD